MLGKHSDQLCALIFWESIIPATPIELIIRATTVHYDYLRSETDGRSEWINARVVLLFTVHDVRDNLIIGNSR